MEEVLMMDDGAATTPNLNEREQHYTNTNQHAGVALNANENVGNLTQKPKGQTPYTITVCISRSNQGYGFSVAWTKPPRIQRVEAGLPADRAGLKPGDYIIFVGEHNVVKYGEEAVLQIIRESGETIVMEVYRRGVSKAPSGIANGLAIRDSVRETTTSNEAHPRKRLSHITFNTESNDQDRQHLIYALINCEQAFSHTCRFGLERYLIPLKFRTDLITQTQHGVLFSNMDQLVDLSETLVDRLMGNEEEVIGDNVGFIYYQTVDDLADNYSKYLSGLPEADKILSHKLHEIDFKDFLLTQQIPRNKPDITTFIHKPAEHLRELVGLLMQVYFSSPGHKDNTYLDTVLDRLKACYRSMTSRQNIMEPTPNLPQVGSAGNALRPPLVSVSDIEQRLVFTKYTQPFRLHDSKRQWVFGGELYKFEGRNLKQYWVMLFNDLLLFTKINRDRVIFVMEDPVPLSAVVHALFTVKKKATEFRLIIDSTVKVSGSNATYMMLPKNQKATTMKKKHNNTVNFGRADKRTLVLRAPTIELKATWNNLIQRQLYVCQQQLQSSPQFYGESAPSLARAVSTDGLYPPCSAATGRFSCSVGDLRPGDESEQVTLDLNDAQPNPPSKPVLGSSKDHLGKGGRDPLEELILDYEEDQQTAVPSSSQQARPPISTNAKAKSPVANHRQPFSTNNQNDLAINIQVEGRQSDFSHTKSSSTFSKVKQKGGRSRKSGRRFAGRGAVAGDGSGGGGRCAEEVVFHFQEDVGHEPVLAVSQTSQVNSAFYNHSREFVPDVIVTPNVENTSTDTTDDHCDDDEFMIEDGRSGGPTYLDPKKGRGIGSKVKDKLFPNRNLPKKKKINRTQKVEKFVDSIEVEDLNRGRVTPLFEREEYLTHEDFTHKRENMLLNHQKNYMEGDTEVITLDLPTLPVAQTSHMRNELMRAEERRNRLFKKKVGKKMGLKLEGIEEESSDHFGNIRKPVISPEAYEDYIGESVEEDYPELAGGLNLQRHRAEDVEQLQISAQREEELYEEEQQRLLIEQQQYEFHMEQAEIKRRKQQQSLERQQMLEQQQQQLADHPTGPLSGSASMSFMDDNSPSNGCSNQDNEYKIPIRKVQSPSPVLAVPDPVDDVLEVEDYDNVGSQASVGRGGHKRKAPPAPPLPCSSALSPPSSCPSAPASENKLGGFFNRVKKDKEKDKERDKARGKNAKKEKEKKDKEKDKPTGKRFQLFGGAKKSNDPNAAEGAEENSPNKEKKDVKGKRRLFGRGKENFLGRSPNISHKTDPQVDRMSGDSFDRDSIDLEEESEYL